MEELEKRDQIAQKLEATTKMQVRVLRKRKARLRSHNSGEH